MAAELANMNQASFRVEREFGLIVGGVLVLLGGWWIYRGKFFHAAGVTLPLGALLIFLGLLWPRALVVPNKAWMLLAEGLSFVTTRLILGLVFFLVVTPIGIAKRLTGWDPLGRRAPRSDSYWKPYSQRQRDPRHYEKMF
ncbi:MAG TPA: SxtJ family membrane protein [Pyrinomonadaceae bacterium]|nr:SxtJ family membrane protein [Pyrinomonadaceae bacterium]